MGHPDKTVYVTGSIIFLTVYNDDKVGHSYILGVS